MNLGKFGVYFSDFEVECESESSRFREGGEAHLHS